MGIIVLVYSLAWTGRLQFDDAANLDGLYGVKNFTSALVFTLTGEAGPTGRPLALATFALQAEHWPTPKPFLMFNTILHAVNGLLCHLLLSRILHWRINSRRHAEWLSVAVTLTWLASPFLSTTNLLVVQRMTGLAGFFTLLCLWTYARAREQYRTSSWRDNLKLFLVAAVGTLMSGLSKESGFLLPIYLLLLERVLISSREGQREPLNNGFLGVVLATPVAITFGYLLLRGFEGSSYLTRDFSMGQRLMTQPRILLDYIWRLLLPSPRAIGPFHDDYHYSSSLLDPTTTLLSIVTLISIIGLAFKFKRSAPIISFGILFFFAGHLLESSVIPLELYFPHRNYIPAIGLYLSAGYALYRLTRHKQGLVRLVGGASACYTLLFLFVLASVTSMWGKPIIAATMWFKQSPQSLRAGLYLHELYTEKAAPREAAHLSNLLQERHPDEPLLAIQSLEHCTIEASDYDRRLRRARQSLEAAKTISVNISLSLQKVAAATSTSACPHLVVEKVDELLSAAFINSNRHISHQAKANLLLAKAQLATQRQQFGKAVALLEQSMKTSPSLDAATMIAYFHLKREDIHSARDHLRKTIAQPPVQWPATLAWRSRLQNLLASLPTE